MNTGHETYILRPEHRAQSQSESQSQRSRDPFAESLSSHWIDECIKWIDGCSGSRLPLSNVYLYIHIPISIIPYKKHPKTRSIYTSTHPSIYVPSLHSAFPIIHPCVSFIYTKPHELPQPPTEREKDIFTTLSSSIFIDQIHSLALPVSKSQAHNLIRVSVTRSGVDILIQGPSQNSSLLFYETPFQIYPLPPRSVQPSFKSEPY